MEHVPRTYTTVQQALDDMDRTIIGEVMREVLQQASASFPLEIICVARTGVQLIIGLDVAEGSATPVIVRAWDWIPPGPMGRPGTVRGSPPLVLSATVHKANGDGKRLLGAPLPLRRTSSAHGSGTTRWAISGSSAMAHLYVPNGSDFESPDP